MKFAICNELYVDWPFEKAFEHAAELGYTGIEIAPFTINENAYDISQAAREEVKLAARNSGLSVIGLHWLLAKTKGLHLTTSDSTTRKKTADYLAELTRLCRELGGDLMVFGSPLQRNIESGMSYQQAFENAVEVIQQVVPVLEANDVTLALEPLGPQEGNFMLTAESGIELAQAIGSPQVRLHLDVKAMSTESKPIPQIVRESKEWIHHFHANDPNRQGPGMGEVEYEPIFHALKEIDYDGWVSVEVFDYEPGIDALAGESIRYMRETLDKLRNE